MDMETKICAVICIYRKDGANIRSTPASEKGGQSGCLPETTPKKKKCVSVCLYDLRVAHVRELRTPIYTPSSQLDITSSTHYRLLFFFFPTPPFLRLFLISTAKQVNKSWPSSVAPIFVYCTFISIKITGQKKKQVFNLLL